MDKGCAAIVWVLLRVTSETTGAAPFHFRHWFNVLFCGIIDGARVLCTRALCMLGKYFPTEMYPQLLYSLDYIQHLIDKDQGKKCFF